MTQPTADVISAVLAKSAEWLRRDLASQDAVLRERAAETLAAMVAAALSEIGDRGAHPAEGQHSWMASGPGTN